MRLDNGRKILVFAGTTEGRRIAEFLDLRSAGAYVSVATEYGKSILEGFEHVQVLCGRMDEGEMERFLEEKGIELVVDATHPFAAIATENIKKACERQQVRYLRCLREDGASDHDSQLAGAQMVEVSSVAQAVEYLKTTKGNIFISTGSKELDLYTEIPGYKERCYARVLSTMESVEKTEALGFRGKHLIAMQGPFSKDMNVAMLKYADAAYFVTKDSGETGGFAEKLSAAEETGAVMVVVGRPKEEGISVEGVCEFISHLLK